MTFCIMFLGCHWNGCCSFWVLQGGQIIRFELQGRCELFFLFLFFSFLLLYCQVLPVGLSWKVMKARYQIRNIKIISNCKQRLRKHEIKRKQSEIAQNNVDWENLNGLPIFLLKSLKTLLPSLQNYFNLPQTDFPFSLFWSLIII